jgi:hypothetical protein
LLCVSLFLSGCGVTKGVKLVKNPVEADRNQSLAEFSNGDLSARLVAVNVRNGPIAWTRHADWDEYLIEVSAHDGYERSITAVRLRDSLGQSLEPQNSRKALVRQSKAAARRYRDAEIEIAAGAPPEGMVGAWAGVTGATIAAAPAGAAVFVGGPVVWLGAASLLAAPGILVGSTIRLRRNAAVNQEIEARHTPLPLMVEPNEAATLNLFFALAPSPTSIEIDYLDRGQPRRLVLDTRQLLAGMHLASSECAGRATECAGP